MTPESKKPINPNLLPLEVLVNQQAEQLSEANKELSQAKAQVKQLRDANVALKEELNHSQTLEEELSINQEALRFQQDRIHSILGSIDDVVWSMLPHVGQILYINDATQKVYGYPISAFLENLNLWQEIVYSEDKQRFDASQKELYITGEQDIEYRIVWPNGEIHWVRVRARLMKDEQGKLLRIDGLTTETTESKKIREQLYYDSLHDKLTGLPNRTLLMNRIDQAIRQYQHSQDKCFAVLFLDLDGFKVINDSMGHLVGDRFLIDITHRLSQCLGSRDTLARLGGDEFVILLENLDTANDAIVTADRIHQGLKSPILLGKEEIFVSASIGIVVDVAQNWRDRYGQAAELLRDADIAMYRAKAKGQGQSQVFDASMYAYAVKRLQLANDLQRAIERQEFLVYYQPIISLASDRIQGFEALVRWKHPEKGLVSPADFIPVAEETDTILKIDELVLRNACSQLSIWQAQFPELAPLSMNVNLSSKHLSKPGLIAILDEVLAITGLDGRTLKLEITESAVIENTKIAVEILQQVKQRNIAICLDDFGTGYSSLSYLDCFSFDTLKIDRSFIERLVGDNDKCEIIKAIINLGLDLDMNVVAEGVETQQQMDKLKALSCSSGQGYGYSPPLKSDIMTTLLEGKQV
ncbi:MAG: EAL domain-containing protein [Cyanobacteria bacterium P01_G01_bin.49]